MTNKFDKAVQNRSSEILDSGKEEITVKENATEHHEFNLDDIIEKTEKAFKNKTYYLETLISEEVKKMAKKQNVSESKLVNDILKHVLNIK